MRHWQIVVTGILAILGWAACRKQKSAAIMTQPSALNYALRWAGPRRSELQKALNHYARPADRRKQQAVAYLISGLPYQTYTELADTAALTRVLAQVGDARAAPRRLVSLKDSLGHLLAQSPTITRYDLDLLDAQFLIENVELAFEVWQKPWARSLSFADFCRYILPYKSPGEKPHHLRRLLLRQYIHLGDTLRTHGSRRALCTAVCQQLQREYGFVAAFTNQPLPLLGTEVIRKCRVGRCTDLSQLGGDVLRAVGLPVAHEVGAWGNYAGTHAWNVLYEDGQFRPFVFVDGPPSPYTKLEVAVAHEHYRRKRSKVWRYCYLPEATPAAPVLTGDPLLEDVSASVLACANVTLPLNAAVTTDWPVYLCVFTDRRWTPVSQGERRGGQAVFQQMGRLVCYLPVQMSPQQQLVPIGPPFKLLQNGRHAQLSGDGRKQTVQLTAKFPLDSSNLIKVGDTYRLVYWQDGWQPVGRQCARTACLHFTQVPSNALLWLQDVSRGREERIFTYENNRQVWW